MCISGCYYFSPKVMVESLLLAQDWMSSPLIQFDSPFKALPWSRFQRNDKFKFTGYSYKCIFIGYSY